MQRPMRIVLRARPNRSRGYSARGCIAALLLSLVLFSAPAAAQSQPAEKVPPKLNVVVSILPQACFVQRIAGQDADVTVLVGPGQSPHVYEPTPKQVTALADAQVFFTVGLPFEDTLLPKVRASFPQLKIVDTRAGIPLRAMTVDERVGEEAHGEHGEEAGAPDPHIWLSPKLVKIQAATMCDALCQLVPGRAAEFRKNLAAFQADLDRVDAEIAAALAPLKGARFFVFHPAFGYFADAYGLKQVPVEIEGKEPSARQIAALIEAARQARVRVIFVQPQFSTRSAEAIAQAIGGAVVPLDDLPRDYLKNLEEMAEKLKSGLARSAK